MHKFEHFFLSLEKLIWQTFMKFQLPRLLARQNLKSMLKDDIMDGNMEGLEMK